MMSLIHDQQIPPRLDHLRHSFWIRDQKVRATQHQLAIQKGIRLRIIVGNRRTPRLVKERESQIKSPIQLHKPLMSQRFRHQNQHSLGASGQLETVQNQARLNRLSQSHFIRQQYPRRNS